MNRQAPAEIDKEINKRHQQVLEQGGDLFSPAGPEGLYCGSEEEVRPDYWYGEHGYGDEAPGWKDQKAHAEELVNHFKTWIEEHKNEITALQIFYDQPYRRRELTYQMIKELTEQILLERPNLAPLKYGMPMLNWKMRLAHPKTNWWPWYHWSAGWWGLTGNWPATIKPWIRILPTGYGRSSRGGGLNSPKEHMTWLRLIKDHIASSTPQKPMTSIILLWRYG